MQVVRLIFALCLTLALGCGDDIHSETDAAVLSDAATSDKDSSTASRAKHRLIVRGKFTTEAEGAPFFAQNLAKVHIPAEMIAGTSYIWVATAGGESIANAEAITAGTGKVLDDLSFEITTDPLFETGPYEFSMVVNTSGKQNPPQEGDLASFSFDGIEEGDPPATGVSIRFNVRDEDAELALANSEFIRF